MKHLVFARSPGVRRGTFEERSLLPVSAACIVANAMRERLTTLCGRCVDLRLWPPAVPCASAWETILRGAQLHVIRGSLCDAAFVLRPFDAQALATLLFGERPCEHAERALSPLESEITRRAIAAVAVTLAPVCGEGTVEPRSSRTSFVTYFELHVLEPAPLCIGIALSREPPQTSAAARERHGVGGERSGAGARRGRCRVAPRRYPPSASGTRGHARERASLRGGAVRRARAAVRIRG